MKLQTKILLLSIVLIFILGLSIVLFVNTALKDALLSDLRNKGIADTTHLAQISTKDILTDNMLSLQLLLKEQETTNKEIAYVFITNTDDNVIAHTFKKFPKGLKNNNKLTRTEEYSIQPLHSDRGDIIDIAVPISNGELGVIHVGFSEIQVSELVDKIIALIIMIIVVALFAVSFLAFVFSDLITRPIHKLTDAVRLIGDGQLDINIDIKSDDEIGELSYAFNNMMKNLTNSTSSIQILNREITERRKAEEALRESNERLQLSVQASNIGLWDWNLKTNEIHFSAEWKNQIGFKEDEIANNYTEWETRLHPGDRDRVLSELNNYMDGKSKGYATEFRFRHKNGSYRWISIRGKILTGPDGSPSSMLGYHIDITERKKAEMDVQKIQQLESIGILAGGIAHDFNNLLSGIVNNIFLARKYIEKDSKGYKNLQSAEQAIERATNLTQLLITFSKGGAPVRKPASIVEIIKESATFVLSGSNVSCEFHVADDLWPVKVDVEQIGQAIHNFILNSNQAMPEGGVIHVHIGNTTIGSNTELPLAAGKYLKIVIQDQGSGIEEDNMHKIFHPYFTTKEMGMGLGLSITHSIINHHKGHISVESEMGNGTSFTIYLPISDKEIEERENGNDTFIKGQGKILLMDDEELVRDAIGAILTMSGYEVEYAEHGEKALELYQKAMGTSKPFDVAILDLTIRGGMGGKETMKNLLDIDQDVKAIVSSGYSNDPVMANFREYGFSDIVAKPCRSQDELNKVLHKVINDKKAHPKKGHDNEK